MPAGKSWKKLRFVFKKTAMANAGINLDFILTVAGLIVWARVLMFYVHGRRYLAIEPRPRADVVPFGFEAVLMAVLVFLFVGQLVQQAFLALDGPPATGRYPELARQLIADSAAKVVVGVVLGYILFRLLPARGLFAGGERKAKAGGWVRIIGLSVLVYLAVYPLVNVLLLSLGTLFVQSVLQWNVPEQHQAFRILSDQALSPWIRANGVVLAAILSPAVEELFFRGLLQNYLYKLTRRPWAAIGLTSVLFALVHAPLVQQMPALWMLSVILGWSYYRYGTLAIPLAVHILFNSISLVLWWLGGV